MSIAHTTCKKIYKYLIIFQVVPIFLSKLSAYKAAQYFDIETGNGNRTLSMPYENLCEYSFFLWVVVISITYMFILTKLRNFDYFGILTCIVMIELTIYIAIELFFEQQSYFIGL